MTTLSSTLPEIDAAVERLAPLPHAVEKILILSHHESSSARDIALVCESAPELSGRIMRLASSPTLGCRQPVGQILQAAVILGMSRIRNLVLAVHLSEQFPRPGGAIDAQRFWKHSFAAAAMARSIGQAAASRGAEDMYLAGLLHDVGACVLAEALPEEYERLLADARANGTPLEDAEAAALGTTHAEAGFQLASRWPIDGKVLDAVRWHYLAPERFPAAASPGAREIATALALAEMTCRHHGWGLVREREPFPESYVPPSAFPQARASLIEAFGAAALASEELRRLAGIVERA